VLRDHLYIVSSIETYIIQVKKEKIRKIGEHQMAKKRTVAAASKESQKHNRITSKPSSKRMSEQKPSISTLDHRFSDHLKNPIVLIIVLIFGIGIITLIAIFVVVAFFVPTNTTMHMHHANHMAHHDHAMHDVTSEFQFLIEMIPHHQEVVDTSRIIFANTQNAELQQLTQEIIVAQEAEIAQMHEWLDMYYSGESKQSVYQNMMPQLDPYNPLTSDGAYLQGMIMHHMMAVMMAEQVLALNPREEVRSFAEQVIAVQNAEIIQMKKLLQ